MAKYEIVKVDDKEVIFDVSQLIKNETVMINATHIANRYGVKVAYWLKTQDTQRYIDAVSRVDNIPHDKLIIVKRGGKYQGTWIHSKLVIAYLRWLDPVFAVKCDMKIRELIKNEQKRKEERLKAKTGYAPLTLAVLSAHNEIKGYHFSNEANLINRIVLGKDAKEFKAENNIDKKKSTRDFIIPEQLEHINALQQYDTILLELGHSYDERKDLLMEYYIKILNKRGRLQQIKQSKKKQIA